MISIVNNFERTKTFTENIVLQILYWIISTEIGYEGLVTDKIKSKIAIVFKFFGLYICIKWLLNGKWLLSVGEAYIGLSTVKKATKTKK